MGEMTGGAEIFGVFDVGKEAAANSLDGGVGNESEEDHGGELGGGLGVFGLGM